MVKLKPRQGSPTTILRKSHSHVPKNKKKRNKHLIRKEVEFEKESEEKKETS